jgi:CheY-like chemotaxis protein
MDKPVVPLKGVKVLLVEDDADTREVLSLGLQLAGARVESVGAASEALDALHDRVPDVIVSDIGLPDEDGLSMMRRIRTLSPDEGGRVPAVAVTAYTLVDDMEEARRAGFQEHFRKPVETQQLLERVAELAEEGPTVERRAIAQRAGPEARAARSTTDGE